MTLHPKSTDGEPNRPHSTSVEGHRRHRHETAGHKPPGAPHQVGRPHPTHPPRPTVAHAEGAHIQVHRHTVGEEALRPAKSEPRAAAPMVAATPSRLTTLRQDVLASIVVFLVALPLCIGIAIASGMPPEAAIITGIVGGIVVGAMPGSSLQVSGPAAGLSVIVLGEVHKHGVKAIGIIVLIAGLLQIVMGIIRMGRWFQAIAASVVAGMLAGIGLLIIIAQLYVMSDQTVPGDAVHNMLGLPALFGSMVTDPAARTAVLLGVLGLLIMTFWKKMPAVVQNCPGPLAAAILVAVVTAILPVDVSMLSVGTLFDAVNLPTSSTLSLLADPTVVGAGIAFALVASAETLFSATAIDQMHDGPKTHYDKELVAQGTGNMVCGVLGALPMTAVIVRSATNVHAGAKTKLSRVLHGVWMLIFAVLAPQVLTLIPITVLAAILIYSGWKLLNPSSIPAMWRKDRGEALILLATMVAIVATDLLMGVGIGLVLALLRLAWRMSHLKIDVHRADRHTEIRLSGAATFLTVPKIAKALDDVPDGGARVDLSELDHLDSTCQGAIEGWAKRRRKVGHDVSIDLPDHAPDDVPAAAH